MNEIKRMQQLAGLNEIRVNNPLSQLYYVYLSFGRLENQMFVKAKNEEEAIELARNNVEEWGGETDWDEGITHEEVQKVDLTDKTYTSFDDLDGNETREQYWVSVYHDDDIENELKSQQGYVWDSGT